MKQYEDGTKILSSCVYLFFIWTIACLVSICPSVVSACPGCKDALFDVSGARQAVTTAHGYAITIALLLGVPLALLGGVAALVVRAQRRSRRPEAP